MKIIPAIDIKDGKCTQLIGGRPETAKYYGDPVETAKAWETLGAPILHVIDLDAALGSGNNTEQIKEIKKTVKVPVQAGGGIRDFDYATRLLTTCEIDRVMIGTLAINDYLNDFAGLREIPEDLRERMIVSVDSKAGSVVSHGWTKGSGIKTAELVKAFEDYVWGFLYTDVDVEGQMKGINIEHTRKVMEATKKPVIASGGITSLGDIKALKDAGAWGVVLGKALYEGKIDYKEALKCW